MAGPVDPGLMGEVGVVATGEEGTDPVAITCSRAAATPLAGAGTLALPSGVEGCERIALPSSDSAS